VELKTVLTSAIETSLPLIEARGHELVNRMPDERIMLDADPNRLSQVVSNLLNNAAKYTPSDGRIELTTFADGDEVVISVTDSGIGIPPASLPVVFEMFTQVANADRAHGGLGIGLTLVRRLVELHGGTVRAMSPGANQGSTFTVRLPLVASGSYQAPAPEPKDIQESAARRVRVLVVDDNIDAAESLSALIELRGHSSRMAHDGTQALRVAKEFLPAVIFLDIGMPGMNGYEVARAIRNTPELGQVTLIALTGWGAENDRAQTREAGFDAHLIKPVMLAAIDNVLLSIDQHAWHG
jgi:CheY-like chemotaxis protein/anti-sigma regulatory factor (Ser/Thr protein kinase)